ncbi:MAG: hypothetical protein CSB44_09505 [Gammaproteobacteria bacterium]|nr:MAG: hypothetical protein CSB44_09505 [Gammaproteobacteria bacterium]
MYAARKSTSIALLVAASSAMTCAFASDVTGEVKAFIVNTDAAGKEKMVEASTTDPGDTMEFRIVFTNNGETSVGGVQVVDPIPENTFFVPDSPLASVDATFEVSIDGGETFELEPVMRIETQSDGTQKEVVIPPRQYTHVRWLPDEALASNGGSQSFSYRVVVE